MPTKNFKKENLSRKFRNLTRVSTVGWYFMKLSFLFTKKRPSFYLNIIYETESIKIIQGLFFSCVCLWTCSMCALEKALTKKKKKKKTWPIIFYRVNRPWCPSTVERTVSPNNNNFQIEHYTRELLGSGHTYDKKMSHK